MARTTSARAKGDGSSKRIKKGNVKKRSKSISAKGRKMASGSEGARIVDGSDAADNSGGVITTWPKRRRCARLSTESCGAKNSVVVGTTGITDLSPDDLECITQYLDTESALALLRTCKKIYQKLLWASGFWKSLCKAENFLEYTVLRNDDGDDEGEDEEQPSQKPRLTWSGEIFHDVAISSEAPLWRKIFMRGVQMRRNICLGRFELWRLFLTDQDNLPVKKMSAKTTFRELRSSHRHSPFNHPSRRVRIHRYWNESYLVALLHSVQRRFNDVFVWSWKECQQPKFLYTFDMQELYPSGLFPTAFFLHQHYLVLMPSPVISADADPGATLRSVIRVHDLSQGMALVGSYDFPEDGYRRHVRSSTAHPNGPQEAAHLHKVGDTAVALCRTPELRLFVFSLPDCQLLREVTVPSCPAHPLENDDLDQRFLMRDNAMMFMFHDRQFFDHLTLGLDADEDGQPITTRHGRLLFVDFEGFTVTGGSCEGPINLKMDSAFDCNSDFIEKIAVLTKKRLVCSLNSGKIVVRDITFTSDVAATYVTSVVIPCPEPLRDDFDSDLGTEVDSDGPTLCVSRNGKMIAEMRHFRSGRKLYAYTQDGVPLFNIDMESPLYGLSPNPGYISVDLDGNFLCAADVDRVVVWHSQTGKYIRTIPIPKHYNVKEDDEEAEDRFCWHGHSDFAFAEDGIIIIHSQRNFPVAADVILFW